MDVFIIATAFTFLIVFFGLRKFIYLYLIKTIYGEYTHKYVMQYKKINNKKPHHYCFKDDFYYHIFSIQNALKHDIQYKASGVFAFDGLDFTKDFKQILHDQGQPDCFTISNDKEIPLKVVGYKSRMFHSNEKTLHYFCDQNYFMGEYVFSSLADDTSKMIVETMKTVFNIDVKYSKNFTILDPFGNHLFFTDTGFFLSIKFFNINNKTVKSIIDFTIENDDKKVKTKSIYDRLKC